MAWHSVPNFGDEYAKVSERAHSSGAAIVEVLYGARDEQGNPTSPEHTGDGHGHWIALEIDGVYQMLSWRHPAYEGGRQEYGRGRSSNALADLEADIAAKEAICRQAETLASSQDWKATSASLRQLFDDWKQIYNWHTPRENELWARFKAAKDSFYDRRAAAWAQAKTAKQAIIAEARALSGSSDWKATGDRLRELLDAWKAAGFAGKDDDDLLWAEFNDARQTFFDRRSKHFEELDEQRAQSRRTKQQLISEARSVAQYSTEWKATGDALHELMGRWKAAGSAGRDHDDALWAEFDGIRQGFYERRRIFYEERDREFLARAERKGSIVQEATAIAGRCDYSAASADRMRELDGEWRAVGFCGRDDEDRLWALFQQAKDSFWSGKRAYAEQRQREWREKTTEAISRKRDQISNLRDQIADLQDKMVDMRNQEYVDNMCRWITEKEARIRELETAIQDMESRL